MRTPGRYLLILGLLIGLRLHPEAVSQVVSVYWADAAIVAVMIGWAVTRKLRLRLPSCLVRPLAVVVLTGASVAAATGAGALVGEGYAPAAALNMVRFLYFTAVVAFVVAVTGRRPDSAETWLRVITGVFLANAAIAAVQLVEPPLLTGPVHALFGTDKLRSLHSGFPRVYAAFFNPNWFGVFVNYVLAGWLAHALSRRSRGWRDPKLLSMIVLCCFAIAVSGSRTAVIGGLVALLVGGALVAPLRIMLTVSAVTVLGFAAHAAGVTADFLDLLGRTADRFVEPATELLRAGSLAELESVGALQNRMRLWEEGYRALLDEPWLGYGDRGLGPEEFIPHSSYLSAALTFGYVGVGMTVIGAGVVSLLVGVGRRNGSGGRDGALAARWLGLFAPAFGAMAIFADFVYTSQVVLLPIVLLGIWIGDYSPVRSAPQVEQERDEDSERDG